MFSLILSPFHFPRATMSTWGLKEFTVDIKINQEPVTAGQLGKLYKKFNMNKEMFG